MKASRISSVPSSIFRNSRQYLHSNELFHRVLEERNFSSGHQHQQHQQQNKSKQTNQHTRPTKVVLNRTIKSAAVRELLMDCNQVLQIQNNLMERATKISQTRNKKAYLRSYRSSI